MKQTAPQPLSPAVICGVDSLTITATVRTSSPSSARNTEAKKKRSYKPISHMLSGLGAESGLLISKSF